VADEHDSSVGKIPVSGARVSLPSDTEILIVRRFDAPPSRVFDAWTNPRDVRLWWDPRGLPLAECEIDLRGGGAFRFVPQPPNDLHPFTGRYREIDRPGRLAFSTPGPEPGSEARALLLFAASGSSTTLSIRMSCASREHRDALIRARVDGGTAATLERLSAFLNHNQEAESRLDPHGTTP